MEDELRFALQRGGSRACRSASAVAPQPAIDVAADHAIERCGRERLQVVVRRVPALGRAPGDGEAFALEQLADRSRTARATRPRARPSAAGSSSVTWSRPSCQCAGVSRRPGAVAGGDAVGRRRRARRTAGAPSPPRQPQRGGQRPLVRRREAVGVAVVAAGGLEQREQALEVRQGEVAQHVPAGFRASEAKGTSRCMRRLSERRRGARREAVE